MPQSVKKGDTVKIHYTGRIKDGNVIDSSLEREPLEFEIGSGSVIAGVDKAMTGMKPGEKKEVTVSPEDAYGEHDQNLLIDVPKEKIPEDIDPKVGMQLQLINTSGQALPALITEVRDESIKLDANHPFAGKELVFDIELLEIV
ncbi:MAG: peptidylprolyl isomerase [Candidatus Aminicenantes bacterium]|jgi:peptidylprolyl isomerase